MAPRWRSALLSTLAGAAVSVLGNLPGIGIPGALALIPVMPLIQAIWGDSPEGMFPNDTAWPFAIMVTLLMGPLVPLLWMLTRAMGLAGLRRGLVVLLGLVLGSGLAALAVYAFGIAPLLRPQAMAA